MKSEPSKASLQNCKAFLFDLDHTLLKVNSSFRFGIYLYRNGVFSFMKFVSLLCYYSCHLLGFFPISYLHEKASTLFFEGLSVQLLKQHVVCFIDQQLDQMLNIQLITILNQAIADNHFVAILSSSPQFLVQPIAERLGVSHYIGTEYSINSDGTLGALVHSVQGVDKAQFVEKLKFQSDEIAAYSDSHFDLPLLKSVGYPVAVNPSKLLRRASVERGWQILN